MKQPAHQDPPLKTEIVKLGNAPASLLVNRDDAFYYANCLSHVLRVATMPNESEPVDIMSLSAVQSLLELLQSVHPEAHSRK